MIRTGIVLAPDKACLQPIFGVPAIRRLVLTLMQLGISDIRILTGDESVRSALSDLIPEHAFFPLRQETDLLTTHALHLFEAERVVVVPGNIIVDHWSLIQLLQTPDGEEIIMPACTIGSHSRGVYISKSTNLPLVLSSLLLKNDDVKDAAIGMKRMTGAPSIPCFIDNTEQSVRAAEAALVQALDFTNQGHDSFLASHVDRPLARFLSQPIARTAANPNSITMINLLVGLAGAAFFALGGYWNQLLGALLFLANVMGDGIDGDVARLKLKETTFGHYLDIISDNVVHIAVFIGIGVGLSRQTGNVLYLQLIPILLGGFGFCIFVNNRLIGAPNEAIQAVFTALNNRDFAYLVLFLALFGHLHWFLIAASAGVYLVGFMLIILRFVSITTVRETVFGNHRPALRRKR